MPDPLLQIAEDYSLKSNLVLILRMIAHEPVRRYEEKVAQYKARVTMPSGFRKLEQRVVNLEARQILTEGELALLRGQLDRVSITGRS